MCNAGRNKLVSPKDQQFSINMLFSVCVLIKIMYVCVCVFIKKSMCALFSENKRQNLNTLACNSCRTFENLHWEESPAQNEGFFAGCGGCAGFLGC